MNWLNKTRLGYVYDKRIFWFVIFFAVVSVLYLFYQNSFDFTPNLYVVCNKAECQNPFYLTDCRQQLTVLFFIPLYTSEDCSGRPEYSWLKEKALSRGEYGTPPPNDFFYKNIRLVVLLVFALALLCNHLIHNKGKKFDIEIPITKKIYVNRDTIKGWFDNEGDKNNGKE